MYISRQYVNELILDNANVGNQVILDTFRQYVTSVFFRQYKRGDTGEYVNVGNKVISDTFRQYVTCWDK